MTLADVAIMIASGFIVVVVVIAAMGSNDWRKRK